MKDEEIKWCKAHSQSRSGEGQDEECIDVNLDERADAEDNIIAGCYVLDIGINGLECTRLWIRPD
jgi:hypothetical protein